MIMNRPNLVSLPAAFCWSRFGPEAGESIDDILRRKNLELAAVGYFFWGIGSAIGPALRQLLADGIEPEVLFSSIKSRPRTVDTHPSSVVRWTRAIDLSGRHIEIPDAIRVTSRWDSQRTLPVRYALVCTSNDALALASHGSLSMNQLSNYVSGSRLGSSQVTAVVRRDSWQENPESAYDVAMRFRLTGPMFVRLADPIAVPETPCVAELARTAA